MIRETYRGPHLHHAVRCLEMGKNANACSWIERDLGEEGEVGYGDINPLSLRKEGCGISFLTHEQQSECTYLNQGEKK